MAEVRIRPSRNDPYEVSGNPSLIDHEGVGYPVDEDPIDLCRRGQSASKPFCDGTRKKAGFHAEECVRPTSGRR
jgi:CDGSH-type Zn-finger protein